MRRPHASGHGSHGSSTSLLPQFVRGIVLCRSNRWEEGLRFLREGTLLVGPSGSVPAVVLSYLGYAMALCESKVDQGLELCKEAVRQSFVDPDMLLNLARAHLLAGNRQPAVMAIERGLKVDRDHQGLLDLRTEIGVRRQPILGFLRRHHPLNRALGMIRHRFGRRSG